MSSSASGAMMCSVLIRKMWDILHQLEEEKKILLIIIITIIIIINLN